MQKTKITFKLVVRSSKSNIYKGSWLNGERNGYGFIEYSNGTSYEGQFKNNDIFGEGTFKWSKIEKYVGGWKKG